MNRFRNFRSTECLLLGVFTAVLPGNVFEVVCCALCYISTLTLYSSIELVPCQVRRRRENSNYFKPYYTIQCNMQQRHCRCLSSCLVCSRGDVGTTIWSKIHAKRGRRAYGGRWIFALLTFVLGWVGVSTQRIS